jgi:hypothetical protein
MDVFHVLSHLVPAIQILLENVVEISKYSSSKITVSVWDAVCLMANEENFVGNQMRKTLSEFCVKHFSKKKNSITVDNRSPY